MSGQPVMVVAMISHMTLKLAFLLEHNNDIRVDGVTRYERK